MSENITVRTLKGFNNGGTYARRGSEITVSELRARELERNGLITRELAAKAAPEPQNKKAPEPRNKKAPVAKNKAS